jgi:[ribosomal protein S18]-alanine N-acetyltransferase
VAVNPFPAGAVRPYHDAVMSIRPLRSSEAEAVAAWAYQGPWSIYDPRPGDALISAEAGYDAVVDDDGSLVGYVCVGQEARVPGLAEADGVLDIGVGMRPDLVGQGLGRAFGTVALEYLRERYGERPLRAVIQSWNERSLRLARNLGFRDAGTHLCVQDGHQVSYTLLVRPADSASASEPDSASASEPDSASASASTPEPDSGSTRERG